MKLQKRSMQILLFILTLFFFYGNMTVLAAAAQPKTKESKKTLYTGYNNYQISCINLTKDAKITYKSDNKSVATVSSKGLVTPVSAGDAKITVTIKQGSKTYTSKVAITVKKPYIIITNKITSLTAGEKYQFNVKAVGLKNPDIVWTVSNEYLGSINYCTGKFASNQSEQVAGQTLRISGQLKITARDKNSGRTSVCYVDITKADLGFDIINKIEEHWCNVSYKFKTEGAEKVKWSVSDASIAAIDENGVFTAKKIGTVTITAEDADTGEKISCKIKTKDIEETPVEVFDIGVNPDSNEAWIIEIKDKSYSEIKFPEKINGIDIIAINPKVFIGESQLKKVIIPPSIRSVGDFYDCDNLESIVIQDRDNRYGDSRLWFGQAESCRKLTEFITPYECRIIYGQYCLYNNISLKNIIIPENVEAIGKSPFGATNSNGFVLEELEIMFPNTLTQFFGDTFGYINNLKIVIPESFIRVDDVFDGCKNVVIYTPKNSTAEQFAIDNGIPYVNY